MGIGEAAALSAAALWAFSSLLYTKVNLTAWGLNFAKIVVASMILLVQLAIVSRFNDQAMFTAPDWAFWLLGISGLIGLVIGDTCYFRSLQILGVRRCLIVTTTAPIFTAVLGWPFLGEKIYAVGMVGIALTVAGVVFVVNDRSTKDDEPGLYPGSLSSGIGFGLAASLCQAIGAVMARHAMTACGALEATLIRLASAAVCVLLVVTFKRQLVATLQRVFRWTVIRQLLPAIICGTWLGVWFSQVAFQYVKAASAQTLLSTSPLFVLPLAWWLTGQKPTVRIMLGVVVAVVGVFLIVHSAG